MVYLLFGKKYSAVCGLLWRRGGFVCVFTALGHGGNTGARYSGGRRTYHLWQVK